MSTGLAEQKYIAISGGFDPIHSGHVDYIEDAARFGRVMVVLNTDEWLIRKKGYVFQKWADRAKILRAMTDVFEVIPAEDDDGTVCKSLELYRPDMFGNGGDRTNKNTPEMQTCLEYGITMRFGLGGKKTQSSSELVKNVQKG